jgi:hypothetical protein
MPSDQHQLYGAIYIEQLPKPAYVNPGDIPQGVLLEDENGNPLQDENGENLRA